MRYLLLACAAAFFVISCNKEQTLEVPLTKTQMLYGNNKTNASPDMPTKWKTKEYKVIITLEDGRDSVVLDAYTECKKDDFLQFFENFSGKHHTADNKCATNDGDIYNYRWEFSNNNDTLNFYNCDRLFNYRTFRARAENVSESSFMLKYREPFVVHNVLDTVRIEHTFEKF